MIDPLIQKALLLSAQQHRGQTDYAGKDYFRHHILTVYNSVGGKNANPIELAVVALLHDVVEDTSTNIKFIEKEFGSVVAQAVKVISKTPGEDYIGYIKRVRSNPLARKVKIADITHNMQAGRLKTIGDKDRERLDKYKIAFDLLK